jgi:hypothetical protein
MRSMVEGAATGIEFWAAPSTAFRRSPSPAPRERTAVTTSSA